MVNRKEKCILCLRTVSRSDYVLFEEIHREILNVLLVNTDSKNIAKLVICKDCLKNVEDSFAFKSLCLYTEDSITPFIEAQSGKNEKIVLSQILQIMKNIETSVLRDKNICRFCMKIIEEIWFTPLKDVSSSVKQMLEKYFPEMNLDATKDPVICEICLSCLEDYSNFIGSCILVSQTGSTRASPRINASKSKRNVRKTNNAAKGQRKKINPTQHRCDKCDFKTFYSSSLHKHALQHENIADIKMYKCDKCVFQTKYKQSIKYHEETHGPAAAVLKRYKCPQCSYEARKAYSMKNHMLRHKSPSKMPLFRCEHCPFTSKYPNSYKYHSIIHADVPTLKCPSCAFETKHKRVMDAHKLTHDKKKRFVCDECNFVTHVKSYLVLHAKRHIKSKLNLSFSCELCPYKTTRAELLSKHKSLHRTQQSQEYKCDRCPFASRYKASLSRHSVVHKDASEIVKLKCESCSYETWNKHQLKLHRGTHDTSTVYKCDVCEFATRSRVSLKTHHVRKHTDPSSRQTFECLQCSFQTKEKMILKNHMAVHSDVFYDCTLCDYQTRHKRNMAAHYRYMHKKENHKIVVR